MTKFYDRLSENGLWAVNGAAVLRARRMARLTQADVADRMKELGRPLSQPSISRLERGEYVSLFNEREITALAAALGVGLSEISGGQRLTRAEMKLLWELAG